MTNAKCKCLPISKGKRSEKTLELCSSASVSCHFLDLFSQTLGVLSWSSAVLRLEFDRQVLESR